MMKTLNQIKPNQKVKIVSVSNISKGTSTRLRCLGIVEGNEIEVVRNWWFNPIHIRVGMTELFIRKKDAKHIVVI